MEARRSSCVSWAPRKNQASAARYRRWSGPQPCASGPLGSSQTLQHPAAVQGRNLTDDGADARVVLGCIHDVAAGIAAAPQSDPRRVALLFAVHPVDRVEQIGRLVERIDDFANLVDLGTERFAGFAFVSRLHQHQAAVALPPAAIVEGHDEVAGTSEGQSVRPQLLRESEITYLQMLQMRIVRESPGSVRLGGRAAGRGHPPLRGHRGLVVDLRHGCRLRTAGLAGPGRGPTSSPTTTS